MSPSPIVKAFSVARSVSTGHLALLFAALLPAHGQWIQTGGPPGGLVRVLESSGTDLFAGTDGGMFRSGDAGANWTASGLGSHRILSLKAVGANLFAGTDEGVHRSGDNGAIRYQDDRRAPDHA
jgi:hypothetical protein